METVLLATPDLAARDDAARLKEMAALHLSFVWRVMRRMGLAADRADDGVQEVFVVATRRIADIEIGRERAFLFGTARQIVRKLRRPSRTEPSDRVDAWRDSTPSPEELSDQKRAREKLDAILDEMDDDLREVLVLYEIEGLSLPEIAELTAAPVGTATSRLRRARENFEKRCKRFGGER